MPKVWESNCYAAELYFYVSFPYGEIMPIIIFIPFPYGEIVQQHIFILLPKGVFLCRYDDIKPYEACFVTYI